MREKEKGLFDSMLREIGEKYKPQERLTGFFAMKGMNSGNELMVVGRSVNGWSVGMFPHDFKNESNRQYFINKIFQESSSDNKCPMSWVVDYWGNEKDYNTKRSAFWRVIYKIALGLNIFGMDEVNWSSFLMWSNLCKISPKEGYNPSNELCDLQHIFCVDILIEELRQWQPKRVLFLTGVDWFDWFFFPYDAITVDGKDTPNNLVQYQGYLNIGKGADPIDIVIARHPQCKPEQTLTDEVLTSFGTLR